MVAMLVFLADCDKEDLTVTANLIVPPKYDPDRFLEYRLWEEECKREVKHVSIVDIKCPRKEITTYNLLKLKLIVGGETLGNVKMIQKICEQFHEKVLQAQREVESSIQLHWAAEIQRVDQVGLTKAAAAMAKCLVTKCGMINKQLVHIFMDCFTTHDLPECYKWNHLVNSVLEKRELREAFARITLANSPPFPVSEFLKITLGLDAATILRSYHAKQAALSALWLYVQDPQISQRKSSEEVDRFCLSFLLKMGHFFRRGLPSTESQEQLHPSSLSSSFGVKKTIWMRLDGAIYPSNEKAVYVTPVTLKTYPGFVAAARILPGENNERLLDKVLMKLSSEESRIQRDFIEIEKKELLFNILRFFQYKIKPEIVRRTRIFADPETIIHLLVESKFEGQVLSPEQRTTHIFFSLFAFCSEERNPLLQFSQFSDEEEAQVEPVTYVSYFNRTVEITEAQSAITLIRCGDHVQMAVEMIDNENGKAEYEVEVAHLTGERKSTKGPGTVTIFKKPPTEIMYTDKSKTWRVERKKANEMWNKIRAETRSGGLNPVFYHNVGRGSLLVSELTDYQTTNRELRVIQRFFPTLFQKICHIALSIFNPKAKPKHTDLCNDNVLWESGFRVGGIIFNKKADNDEKIHTTWQLLELIFNMIKSNNIVPRKIKAHNCASWTEEKLAMVGIKLNKPRWNWIAFFPKEYIDANK